MDELPETAIPPDPHRQPLLVRVGLQATRASTHAITVGPSGVTLDLTPTQAQALARDLQLLVAIQGDLEPRDPPLFTWRTLDSAPRDGTRILVRDPLDVPARIVACKPPNRRRWYDRRGLRRRLGPGTVWAALPSPPSEAAPAPWQPMETAPRDGTWILATTVLQHDDPWLVRFAPAPLLSILEGAGPARRWRDRWGYPAPDLLHWLPLDIPPVEEMKP